MPRGDAMTQTWHLLTGDVRERLAELPDASVQCCVTSPPYWGLRDYGIDGQLGLEPTPDAYVASMVAVFREVRRVLRDDGTLWLNLGDSYSSSGGMTSAHVPNAQCGNTLAELVPREKSGPRNMASLAPKQLIGIPWRVAFALQADGWYLRADIIWNKPNPMPESVTDRPTKSHEYVFLLTKSAKYFYDADAVREAATESTNVRDKSKRTGYRKEATTHGSMNYLNPNGGEYRDCHGHRNCRSVWTMCYDDVSWINAIGSCRKCGNLRVAGNGSEPTTVEGTGASRRQEPRPSRVNSERIESLTSISSGLFPQDSPLTTSAEIGGASDQTTLKPSRSKSTSTGATLQPLATSPKQNAPKGIRIRRQTLIDALTADGNAVCVCETEHAAVEPTSDVWQITTQPYPDAHFATFPEALPERCITAGTKLGDTVLDPFAGSGTTGQVAVQLGRSFIGIELNAAYADLARTRISGAAPLFAQEIA
jgi:DNA modification methylase